MAKNNDPIAAGLAGVPESARKAFLARAFGAEDYASAAAALRRENGCGGDQRDQAEAGKKLGKGHRTGPLR